MREILFRGKLKDNGEWVYGYLFKIWDKTYILWGTTNGVPNTIEVLPETVGQFTGLLDKNGKKIFEGDIIDASDEDWDCAGPAGHDFPILEVVHDKFTGGFDPFATYDCDCGMYISARGCVVLCNIHDNPELRIAPLEDYLKLKECLKEEKDV